MYFDTSLKRCCARCEHYRQEEDGGAKWMTCTKAFSFIKGKIEALVRVVFVDDPFEDNGCELFEWSDAGRYAAEEEARGRYKDDDNYRYTGRGSRAWYDSIIDEQLEYED